MESFIFVLEIIGTIAFASSGAMVAIEKKMDIFGVNILGATTAVGGGIMRDVILGLTPPTAFAKPVYILFAVATSTLLFFIVYINPDIIHSKIKCKYYDRIMLWCDTVGLGIFTVLGVQTASKFVRENMFFFVFIGVLTGVGGGVLRDPLYSGKADLCLRLHCRWNCLCSLSENQHDQYDRYADWNGSHCDYPFPGCTL